MIKFELNEFFTKINYDYKKDLENLSEIMRITKTRYNPKNIENLKNDKNNVFVYGMEQTFLIKAICEYFKCKKFLEIGTGRGTASYAVSLCESIELIETFDIIPFEQKMTTAIGFEYAYASNKDLYTLIRNQEKEKILFKHINDQIENNDFDLAFIDGEHDQYSTIFSDYQRVKNALAKDGIILWDDYDPKQFMVKKVVEDIMDTEKYNLVLVEFRGHLFGESEKEKDCGLLIMTNKEIF